MFVNLYSTTAIALYAILLASCFFYVKYLYSYWERRGVPQLKPIFPFGNFAKSFMQKLSLGEQVSELYHRSTPEPFIGIYGAHLPILMLRDPQLIRNVLIKDFQHFTDRGVYFDEKRDPMSAHLFAIEGDAWKSLRQKLTPAFTSGKMRAIFPTLLDCKGPLQSHISQLAETNRITDVHEMAASYTINVIASVAFGIDIDCLADPSTPFRVYGRKIFAISLKNGFRFASYGMSPKLLKWSRLRLLDRDVEEFFLNLTKQTLEMREKQNIVRKDFFQLLIQLRNCGEVQVDDEWQTFNAKHNEKMLSLNELAAQVMVFYAAGYETSASTIAFCLFEIARSPDIQRKVHEELDRVLAQHNGQFTYDSINDLKYLQCCIDETLRKYPALQSLNRICTNDYKIPGTNVTIEKGTSVLIPTFPLHRDKNYYPDPMRFDPMRFDSANRNGKTLIDMPYYPFGDGPRYCIGMQLGKLSTKIGLVSILQKHWVDVDDRHIGKDIELSAQSFVLAPTKGIHVKFEARQ